MKQHYLPRFYLKNWKVKVKHRDNQIWLYEKNKAPEHCSIQKNAGAAINFYAFELRDGSIDNVSIEKQLSAIESRAAPIFTKIVNQEKLSAGDKETLTEFISIFWRRVPFHKQGYERQLAGFIPEYFSELYKELEALGIKESDARFKEIQRIEKQYREKIPDQFYADNVLRKSIITEAIIKMDWAFMVAPPETEFVTSDNPFIFSRGAGLGNTDKGHSLFPISPGILLQTLWTSDYRGKYISVSDSHAREVNKRIVSNAYRQVFYNKKSNVFANFVNKWIGTELSV